ncbi:hypothetical protein ACHHYP_07963 [Achlya hypogyna]|uniref:RNA ligase domain-containing protein n=1 Tax=Achlya hypogyna TaxID=1202772 RepID=A0A1V9YQ71_ACHHY|nr:hypothetical protein ACHHYP_07963 [Achlya hypogyna]
MDCRSIQADEIEALQAIFDVPTTLDADDVVTLEFHAMATFTFTRSRSYPIDKLCPTVRIPFLHAKYAVLAQELAALMTAAGSDAVVHGQVCLFEMVDAGLAYLKAAGSNTKNRPPPSLLRRNSGHKPPPTKAAKAKKNDAPPPTEKKSMRTATDVIHRIMWDDSINQSEVVVGYLDRFVGIMERNFTSFNWGDIATLSHAETAIPQHRIQYFSWRGDIIWDKRCRMDRVFGSSGHDVVDFAAAPAHPEPIAIAAAPSAPALPVPTFHSNKDRPNAFLSIRITDAGVVELCRQVQTAVITADSRLAASAIPAVRFHCTLVLMRLLSLRDLWVVERVLAECQGLLHATFPAGAGLRIAGVGAFGNRLVYADVAPHAGLAALVAALKSRLAAAGILLVGNRDPYVPHVTLCKLSRELSRTVATIDKGSFAAFATVPFGEQPVAGMELCAMGAQLPTADGFYQRFVATVPNALPPVLPALPWDVPVTKQHVFVLRGVPGSGKSSLARHLRGRCDAQGLSVRVCSADAFFEQGDGGYIYDRSRLAEAHAFCHAAVLAAVAANVDVVVVDNTNLQARHVHAYLDALNGSGYRVSVVAIETSDIPACIRRSCHAVPLDKYADGPEPLTGFHVHTTVLPAIFPAAAGAMSSVCASNVRYAAIFLDPPSRQRLLATIAPVHAKVHADHVTLAYAPTPETLAALHLGTTVKVLVTGDVANGETQAVTVVVPSVGLIGAAPHPHITISVAPGGAAKHSATLLASTPATRWQMPLALSGVVGMAPVAGGAPLTTFGACVNALLPAPVAASLSASAVHVFDFDLTLVRAPLRHHGEAALTPAEVAAIGPDWYKSPLSLHPRQKLVPLPALARLKEVAGATDAVAIVLTARHEPLREAVLRVLAGFGATPDAAILKPAGGHRDLRDRDPAEQVALRAEENAAFKLRAIESLVAPAHVSSLTVYEDDDAILERMLAWATRFSAARPGLDIRIIDAKRLPTARSVRNLLANLGCVPSEGFVERTQWVLAELQRVAGARRVIPFGSYALGRRGDVDVCLVLAGGETARAAVARIATALRTNGVADAYASGSSRCPLLKVRWPFPQHAPVELDVVFLQEAAFAAFSPATHLDSRSVDPNVRSLMGLQLLEEVKALVAGSPVPSETFARLVDVVLLVLQAQGVHGTAANGLPSFKLTRLAAQYVATLPAPVPLKELVSGFFHKAAMISDVEWTTVHLDGVFVAPHALRCAQQAFLAAKHLCEDPSFPSSGTLSRLLQPRDPSASTSVSLRTTYKPQATETTWTLTQQFKWKLAKTLRDLVNTGNDVDPMAPRPGMARTFGVLGDIATTTAQLEVFAVAISSESSGMIHVEVVIANERVIEVATSADYNTTDVTTEGVAPEGVAMSGVLAKFPRTKHLLPSAGVTRDDLVMDPHDARAFIGVPVTIQEKVDGANLGLFLTDDYQVVAQNRSHFCNAATAPQFKGLDVWIQVHQFELIDLLSPPGRYVLYGEWLFAKHSLHYTKLPSYFLAFDLLDRSTETFWAAAKLQRALKDTSIHLVPTIATTTIGDVDEYRTLLETPSQFYDGPVEGFVVRKETAESLVARAKLVRDDFIQEIQEHWAKKGIVKNQLAFF